MQSYEESYEEPYEAPNEQPSFFTQVYIIDIRISEAENAVAEAQKRLENLKAERAGLVFQCELQQDQPGANILVPQLLEPPKRPGRRKIIQREKGLRKNSFHTMRCIVDPKWSNYRMIDTRIIEYLKISVEDSILVNGKEYIRLTKLPEYSTAKDHARSNCIYCDKFGRSHGNTSFPYKAFCDICAAKVVYVGPKF